MSQAQLNHWLKIIQEVNIIKLIQKIYRKFCHKEITSLSLEKNHDICSQKIKNNIVTIDVNIRLYFKAIMRLFLALSGSLAQRFCHTNVAAAFPSHQIGKSINIYTLTAI